MSVHPGMWAVSIVVLCVGVAGAQAMKVPIDVKPGDTPTTIERDRGGFLPVAILSTTEFDALSVDTSTVRVGPTGTEAEPARSMQSDVNGDERVDLMVLVPVQALKITCDVKSIRLTATTMSGTAIEGAESVVVEGCLNGSSPGL